MDRREILRAAFAGALTMWARPLVAGQRPAAGPRKLTNNLSVFDAGGTNVVALSSSDGILLVDTGAPNTAARLMADLKGLGGDGKVHTVFNTHYHLPQTGNNEAFAAAGAKIVAHDRTRQWMSV